MKKIMMILAPILILTFALCGLSYSETLDIGDLVDNFQKATDLQRKKILDDNLGREISITGKVNNVAPYDLFDTVSDIKGSYYQLTLEQEKTKNNIPYQVIFLTKDKDKVKDADKGQDWQQGGKIIRILDERLQISVWLYLDGEISPQEKTLFK